MADYAISNVPRRVVYANSGVGPYAFTFEILSQTDISVYRSYTLLTLTTDYSVTINANGTGSVTLVTAGTGNITIVGAKNIQRTTDFTTGGDLFANSLNDELDNQTIFVQQVAETAERGLKAPVTDPTDIAMTLPAKASRAGKTLAFDANGNPVVGEDIGNWRGNWTAGTAYTVRDLVKDASNYNVYRCNTAHTASGTTPISSNADSAKWDLVIDAEYAADQADAAAASAAAAQTAETNAETAETNAETAETNAETAASTATTQAGIATTQAGIATTQAGLAETARIAAQTAKTAAELAETNAETAEANAETAQAAAELAETNAETAATTATTQAGIATTQAGIATTQAGLAATAKTNAETAEANAETAQAAAEVAQAAAEVSATSAEDSKNDVLALAATIGATIADWGFINTSPTSTSDYGAL